MNDRDAATPAAGEFVDRPTIAGTTRAWFERRVHDAPVWAGQQGVIEVLLVIDDSVEALTPRGYAPVRLENAESAPFPEKREVLLGTEERAGRPVRVYRIERRAFRAKGPGAITLEGPTADDLGGAASLPLPPRTLPVAALPKEGRPADFHEGDVGVFNLRAAVSPREVRPGGVAQLTVTVDGFGHVPEALTLPAAAGVSFGAPQIRESYDLFADRLHHTRVFTWNVIAGGEGVTELGVASLPFWDPTVARYVRGEVPLGRLVASPAAEIAGADGGEAPLPVVVHREDTPLLAADSPVTTALGGLLVAAGVVGVIYALRRRPPSDPLKR